jgi:hypothetical protein
LGACLGEGEDSELLARSIAPNTSESERSIGLCGGDWNPGGGDGGGVGMLRSILPSALISISGYSILKYLRASL